MPSNVRYLSDYRRDLGMLPPGEAVVRPSPRPASPPVAKKGRRQMPFWFREGVVPLLGALIALAIVVGLMALARWVTR